VGRSLGISPRHPVPVTTISTSRLPHAGQASRCRQSGTGVPAPYLCACSAGSGSIRCPQFRHQTIKPTPAAAALPSVIGGPGGDFFRRSALGASSLLGCRLRWSILPQRRGLSHSVGTRASAPALDRSGLGDPAWREQRADELSAATEALLFRRSQLRVGEFRFNIFEHLS
jgi:hypothetical protein